MMSTDRKNLLMSSSFSFLYMMNFVPRGVMSKNNMVQDEAHSTHSVFKEILSDELIKFTLDTPL